MALIDSSAQVSSVSSWFCEELALEIQPLGQLLELEGTWATTILYLGFKEVSFQIPGIQYYNEDVLLLVITTTTYSQMVPVVVGSETIDRALSMITKGELEKAKTMWRQAHSGAVMSGLLQLFQINSSKMVKEEEVSHSSPGSDPVEVWMFSLDDVRSPVHTTQKVTIPLFGTVSVCANTSVKAHCMQVHVLTEPMLGPQLPTAVIPTVTYGQLHPGSSRVPICLHNLSAHSVEIPTRAMDGQVVPTNQVSLVVHPTRTTKESHHISQNGWVLVALDLQGLNKWPEPEKKQARELLLKWEHLFAHRPGSGQNCSD